MSGTMTEQTILTLLPAGRQDVTTGRNSMTVCETDNFNFDFFSICKQVNIFITERGRNGKG
jgi:hypothetical protein